MKSQLIAIWTFFRNPLWRGIRLGTLCGLLAWLLSLLGVFRGMEDWLFDGWFFYRGDRPTSTKVVIVGLDEGSLDALGKPYAYLSPELAKVITHLEKQGAKAIGVDLLVPQSMSQLSAIKDPEGIGSAEDMGKAVLQAGNVVLPQWRMKDRWHKPLIQWQLKSFVAPGSRPDFGFANLTEDDDQFVRRQQLLLKADGKAVPHLSLAILAKATGKEIQWDNTNQQLMLGDEPIPLDAEQKLRINFVGPPNSIPVIPFQKVLASAQKGQSLPEINDAIVFIGVTARSQKDFHNTPFANRYARYLATSDQKGGLMAGTELLANIVATIQDQAYFIEISTPLWLFILLGTGAGMGWMLARVNLEWGFVIAVIHHFLWKGISLLAFTTWDLRLPQVGMLLMGFLIFAATFAMRWRALRHMFGVTKSESIAMALESDPRKLNPGGENREITVLFADIRSFTSFSEKHTAHEVVQLLNEYFGAIAPILEKENATINSYIGDGVMVLFGAPQHDENHVRHAVKASVNMVRKVHELKDKWTELGNPEMRIGVGVHTGTAVIGAIGSPNRLEYTAIGDTVNASARIESENKAQGTEVLISEQTWSHLTPEEREEFGCASEPREVEVKGKKETLKLYEVVVP